MIPSNITYENVIVLNSKMYHYARNSIGINREGYSGCGGLEKITEKSEKLLKQLKEVDAAFG